MSELPVVLYTSPDGRVVVNALVKDETLWMTQAGMAELFEVDKSSISRHLRNLFEEGELEERVVVATIATTTPHGAMEGAGTVSRTEADRRAWGEYEQFNRTQQIVSDFDREMKRLLGESDAPCARSGE